MEMFPVKSVVVEAEFLSTALSSFNASSDSSSVFTVHSFAVWENTTRLLEYCKIENLFFSADLKRKFQHKAYKGGLLAKLFVIDI